MKPIRIGRWHIELYQRAIHVQQIPDPECPACDGEGGWWDGGYGCESPEPVTCSCTERLRHLRIPLWRRTQADYTAEAPF